VASPLPRECSTTELKGHLLLEPSFRQHTELLITKPGAGEGNRTLVISLEGFSSTIELHPRGLPLQLHANPPVFRNTKTWWRGLDSNQRTRKRADLQSAAINHSATPPQGTPNYIGQRFA